MTNPKVPKSSLSNKVSLTGSMKSKLLLLLKMSRTYLSYFGNLKYLDSGLTIQFSIAAIPKHHARQMSFITSNITLFFSLHSWIYALIFLFLVAFLRSIIEKAFTIFVGLVAGLSPSLPPCPPVFKIMKSLSSSSAANSRTYAASTPLASILNLDAHQS